MFLNSRRSYHALSSQRSNAVRQLHRYGSAQRKPPPLSAGGDQWCHEHAVVKQAAAVDGAVLRKNTVITS